MNKLVSNSAQSFTGNKTIVGNLIVSSPLAKITDPTTFPVLRLECEGSVGNAFAGKIVGWSLTSNSSLSEILFRTDGASNSGRIEFITSATGSSSTKGSVGTAGNWTFGPTSGLTTSHLVQADIAATLVVKRTAAARPHIVFKTSDDTTRGYFGADASGFAFVNAAGGTVNATLSDAGALTIGTSGGLNQHFIYGSSSGLTGCLVVGATSTARILELRRTGTSTGSVFLGTNDTQALTIQNGAGTAIGNILQDGTWNIGSGSQAHTSNGTFNVIVNNTAPFTWSLTSSSASGILGIRGAVSGRDRQYIVFNNTNSSTAYWFGNDGNFRGGSTSGITTDGSADGGTIIGTQTSDERLKSNIEPLEYGLNEILQLQPIRFDRAGSVEIGFGAQTTQPILPETVYDTREVVESDPEGSTQLAMDYSRIIPVLVNAVKELKAQVDALQAQIDGY